MAESIKKTLFQIILIIILSCIIGFGINYSLIKRYIKGEFKQSFLSSEEYPNISFITLAEAEDLFFSQEAVFVDSREKDAFRSGHIVGALSIPYTGSSKEDILREIQLLPQETLVVYCDGSECQSSIALARMLHENGIKDIKVFFGGWKEWVNAGLPVEQDD